MKGRKPKPTAIKKMTGNPGKRRLNKKEPTPDVRIPTMPKWIKGFPVAVKEWRRLSRLLASLKVMTEADCDTLARYCYLYGQLQDFAVDIAKRGEFIVVSKIGRDGEEWEEEVVNPRVLRIEKMLSELRQVAGLMGLDPSSRSKLSIQSEPEDPLEEFLRKKENSKGLALVGGKKA